MDKEGTTPNAPVPVTSGPLSTPPAVAWIAGIALLLAGFWIATDGDTSIGWMVCSLGLVLMLIGGTAQGVAWGMDIHKERHP